MTGGARGVRGVVAGVLAGACCAIVVACGASRAKALQPVAAPRPAAPSAMGGMDHGAGGGEARAEIARLSQQIDQQRAELSVEPPPPLPGGVCEPPACDATPMAVAPSSTACHPGTSDTCRDSCRLSDSICDDAKKICDLAQQLAGDTWAAGKCATAKQTCDGAHKKCCDCQL